MRNKYAITYLPIAEDDLNEIIDYLLIDNPDYAQQFLSKFDESISRLAELPYIGSIPKDHFIAQMNYRIIVIESYLVFYIFSNDTIEIHRIINSKRKYDYLL